MNQEMFEKVRDGRRLHRCARSERRQHTEGAEALRPRRRVVCQRGRDVRPDPRDAHADHHEPELHGDRLVGAILFEMTMDRDIEGRGSAEYLWKKKHVVPFLKIDKGIDDEADGVQLMKPMPGLDALLARAAKKGVFGTKERSIIKLREPGGHRGSRRSAVRRRSPDARGGAGPDHRARGRHPQPGEGRGRDDAEGVDPPAPRALPEGQPVMFKLTLPERGRLVRRARRAPEGAARGCVVGRVLPRRGQSKLSHNPGVIASFSRAAHRGARRQQTDDDFDDALDASMKSIFEASRRSVRAGNGPRIAWRPIGDACVRYLRAAIGWVLVTETRAADRPVQELERVVIRFAGDSGDGMQLTGDRFTSASAVSATTCRRCRTSRPRSGRRRARSRACRRSRSTSPTSTSSRRATLRACSWR